MSDDDPRPNPPVPATPEPAPGPESPMGMPGLGGLLEQAQQMQSQLLAAQQEAAETVVEGAAGGGVVKVEVTGAHEFRSVTIEPSAVDPDDVEMLQDLVLAALHDAMAGIAELQQDPLGDLDLGGLGDALGGGLGGLGGSSSG